MMPIDPNEFDRENLSSSLEPEPKGAASCPEQRPLSEIARLMYALIAPAKTFSDLRRKPSWWVPLGLIGSASLAYVLASLSRLSLKPDVVDPRIGALYSSPLVGRLPFFPGIDVSPHLLYMAPLVYPLFYLLLALTCFGVLKLSGVADTTDNSTLALIAYSALPWFIVLTADALIVRYWEDPYSLPYFVKSAHHLHQIPAFFVHREWMDYWPVNERIFRSRVVAVWRTLFIVNLWTIVLRAVGLHHLSKLRYSKAIFGLCILEICYWLLAWYVLDDGRLY
jgi:hypothetical protein